MPGWLAWALLALVGWFVLAFLIARAIGLVSAPQPEESSGSEEAEPERAAPAPAEIAPTQPEWVNSRRRILVVDDDSSLRLLLRTTLAADEFELEEVASAEEAGDVARFWRPSVVLLDVTLPGLDGLSFCKELTSSEPMARRP